MSTPSLKNHHTHLLRSLPRKGIAALPYSSEAKLINDQQVHMRSGYGQLAALKARNRRNPPSKASSDSYDGPCPTVMIPLVGTQPQTRDAGRWLGPPCCFQKLRLQWYLPTRYHSRAREGLVTDALHVWLSILSYPSPSRQLAALHASHKTAGIYQTGISLIRNPPGNCYWLLSLVCF